MALRSGEVAFVRKLRAAFARSEAAGAPTPRELARLEGRVVRAMRGNGIAELLSPRFLGLAAAAAVCVVWFVRRPAPAPERTPSATSYALEPSRDSRALRTIELDTLLKALPGASIVPAPILVADFERIADLSRVTIVGPGAPSLSAMARMGHRSLRTEAGPAESPTEVILAMPGGARSQVVHTVSAWVQGVSGPVEVSLGSTEAGAGPMPGVLARQVEPGAWRWVTFTVPGTPSAGAGAPLSEVRLRLTGTGQVLLDQVEVWCAGGSHGG